MVRRIESPSSINTYLQCPRKYYYRYIEKLSAKESVAMVRGKIVHSVLEDFFKINLDEIDFVKFYDEFRLHILDLFHKHWKNAIPHFLELGIDKDKVLFLYTETLEMIENFLYSFCTKLDFNMKTLSLADAFNRMKPRTEVKYISEKYNVQGFVDVVEELDDDVILWDYKTSKKADITNEYRLQLGIYALLYNEIHGKLPNKVGINFLKHGCDKVLNVDEELIKEAKLQCEIIHLNTESNNIKEYVKKPGPLCKWRDGECDFYQQCFGSKCLNYY